jgi:hypothetical protein
MTSKIMSVHTNSFSKGRHQLLRVASLTQDLQRFPSVLETRPRVFKGGGLSKGLPVAAAQRNLTSA